MLEKWMSAVNKGKLFGALSTDHFKAFNCFSQNPLLTKIYTYVVGIAALRLIHSCLTNRNQRTKLNLPYSPWEEI